MAAMISAFVRIPEAAAGVAMVPDLNRVSVKVLVLAFVRGISQSG